MMKKQILALLVASTLGLAGCGDESALSGSSTLNYETAITESLKAPTKVDFQLQGPDANVPTPSFLLLDSFDGTLNIPITGDATDLSNPLVALNQTDGWSPNQAILIPFKGIELDAATLSAGVRVAKVPSPTATATADNSASSAEITVPELLTFGVDYITALSGDSLAIVPLKPLPEKTDFFYAITDAVKDTNGNSVGMSGSYATLKTRNTLQTIEPLKTAQSLIYGIEQTMAALGVSENVIYSSWYTTGSVGDVVNATKAAIALSLSALQSGATLNQVWKGNANPYSKDLTGLYTVNLETTGVDFATAVEEDENLTDFFGSNAAAGKAGIQQAYAAYQQAGISVSVFKGTVRLPSYLETSVTDEAWKKTPFQAAIPSLAKLSNTLSTGSDADKVALATQLAELQFDTSILTGSDTQALLTEAAKLLGVTLTLADGSALDPERVITQYNPIPQIKDVVDVPVIMYVPSVAGVQVADPGVLLYQHGITSRKENSYLFAANHMALAAQNGQTPYAILAYDQPLHGERALSDGTVADDDNIDVYMNLAYLPVARDNARQSALDTIGIRAALTVMKSTAHPLLNQVDLGNISIMGHSLGGITAMTAYNGLTTSLSTEIDAVFATQAAVIANAGSGISPLLFNSGAYGSVVKHSLLIASNFTYQAFYSGVCAPSETLQSPAACYDYFISPDRDALPIPVLTAEQLAAIEASFAQFSFAAQTVLDAIDPINFAHNMSAPVYLIQSENDSTIPNSVAGNPIAGTEPLIATMGLSPLTDTVTQQTTRVAARFYTQPTVNVFHSTVIAPDFTTALSDQAATAEMQTQIATFVAQKGQGVTVTNATLLTQP